VATAKKPSNVSASFDPKTANVDSAHQVVDLMLSMAGCPRCGRLSMLTVNFASNPPNIKIQGVINVESGG
jgi:hypothetical protein